MTLLTLCASLLLGAPLSSAQELKVAEVTAVRGLVKALNPHGEQRTLTVNNAILQSDTVQTGSAAKIQLRFLDQTIINLGQNTSMTVAEFKWDQDRQQGTLETNVQQGVFRVLGGLITKKSPQNFSMETPVATIGIRGSSYAGRVEHDQVEVVFLSGVGIFVSNPAGTVDLSDPGAGTTVATDGPPTAPEQWSSEKMQLLSEEYGDISPRNQPIPNLLRSQSHRIEAPETASKQTAGHSPKSFRGTLSNNTTNKGSANAAVGTDNKANLGTIALEDIKGKGVISNQSQNIGATNIAAGKENTANLGSVEGSNATINGAISNQTLNDGASNAAIGHDNKSNQGSVIIK